MTAKARTAPHSRRMGILDNPLASIRGANTWPPKDIAARWEALESYAALRENNGWYIRAAASASAMGGASKSYIASPWARRLSLTAAHMLFGEAPRIMPPNEADGARVEEIVKLNDFHSRARAAAFIASSEGGVYGKVTCSPTTPRSRKAPTLQFVSERRVIPTFANVDELVAATIVTEWADDNQSRRVWRLLEIHEPGVIRYELYQGSNTQLGTRVPLSTHNRTAALQDEQATGIEDALLVTYIPNDRAVDSPYGVSDYRGLEDMLLALNETLTTGQDQQRLLKKKLIMDETLQAGGEFVDDEVLWVSQRHTVDGSGPIIQPTPGDWKAGEHVAWANTLLDLTLTLAGVSPQTLGRDLSGGATSGVALKLKTAHTRAVMAAKAQHMEAGIAEMFALAARLDAMTVGTAPNIKPAQPWTELGEFAVELQDGTPTDDVEIADVVTKAKAAGAMSRYEAIKRLNSDWDEAQVAEEEARLDSEAAAQTGVVSDAAKAAVSALPPLTLPPLA